VKRKRLLIGLTFYYPNLSGLTKYAGFLAENFVKKNIEVEVICSKHEKNMKLKESVRGVSVFRVGGLRLGKGMIMPTYPFWALLKVRKSDVVNCHLPCLESFWLAFWSKIFRKKLIVTYHCFYGKGWLAKSFINLIHNFVCFLADTIVVNTKDYIVGNGLLKPFRKKLVEIYPPVEIKEADKEEKEEVRKKINFRKDEKIIGFLGRVSREKKIEILIGAIPFLLRRKINFRIVLAGPDKVKGEEKYRLKIENLIQKHKKEVIKIGIIKNPIAFFEKCDCLVLPSIDRLESFGMVQMEAMSCGVACVTSNLPGIRVPIEKTGMGELFVAGSSKSLAEKIETVLKNKDEYKKNWEKVKTTFNREKSIKRYEEIFFKN